MHMQVVDFLPAVTSAVDNQAITVFSDALLSRYARGYHEHMSEIGLVLECGIVYRGNELVSNN